MNNGKIDMVYLWCDGNDPAFKARRNQYAAKIDDIDPKSTAEARFIDNDELKYSLRSVEMYIPWINHVYIVTDRQVPKWLNTDYEKVTVVDHSEIMPQDIIPCFNSTVLEYFITNIEGLSEKFLFGNDDTFIAQPLQKNDFFIGNKPIVRLKKMKAVTMIKKVKRGLPFYNIIYNGLKIINSEYGRNEYYEPHHNIDAYCKSYYQNFIKKHINDIIPFIHHKFRENVDIQRTWISYDAVCTNNAILKIVKYPKWWDKLFSFVIPINCETYCDVDSSPKYQQEIKQFKPKMFCINAGGDSSNEMKLKAHKFYESLFPNKSKFEK